MEHISLYNCWNNVISSSLHIVFYLFGAEDSRATHKVISRSLPTEFFWRSVSPSWRYGSAIRAARHRCTLQIAFPHDASLPVNCHRTILFKFLPLKIILAKFNLPRRRSSTFVPDTWGRRLSRDIERRGRCSIVLRCRLGLGMSGVVWGLERINAWVARDNERETTDVRNERGW